MEIKDKYNKVYQVELLSASKESMYPLLLLADETVEAINHYLFTSDLYVILDREIAVGVFCLCQIDTTTIEIKNIAINAALQNSGIGSAALNFVKEMVLANGYQTLLVGTSDTGIDQIRFYERNGFVKYGIKKDFFIEHYTQLIIENGVQLIDMVMLKYSL